MEAIQQDMEISLDELLCLDMLEVLTAKGWPLRKAFCWALSCKATLCLSPTAKALAKMQWLNNIPFLSILLSDAFCLQYFTIKCLLPAIYILDAEVKQHTSIAYFTI
jgi:hypothetical protein